VSSPDWYELGGGRRVVKGCRHFPKRTLVIETKKERRDKDDTGKGTTTV